VNHVSVPTPATKPNPTRQQGSNNNNKTAATATAGTTATDPRTRRAAHPYLWNTADRASQPSQGGRRRMLSFSALPPLSASERLEVRRRLGSLASGGGTGGGPQYLVAARRRVLPDPGSTIPHGGSGGEQRRSTSVVPPEEEDVMVFLEEEDDELMMGDARPSSHNLDDDYASLRDGQPPIRLPASFFGPTIPGYLDRFRRSPRPGPGASSPRPEDDDNNGDDGQDVLEFDRMRREHAEASSRERRELEDAMERWRQREDRLSDEEREVEEASLRAEARLLRRMRTEADLW
jgi:hypothetical protein